MIAKAATALNAVIFLSFNPIHANPPINEEIARHRMNLIENGGSSSSLFFNLFFLLVSYKSSI